MKSPPKKKASRKKGESKQTRRDRARKLRTLPKKASPNAVKRAKARKASGQSCVLKTAAQLDKETRAMGFFAPSKGGKQAEFSGPPIVHSTELAQRQAQDPLRRDVLLLAAESGLNPRTTYRWLTGEPINKRKGVYGTTHKTLVEVAARLGIERRGEGPVRGSEEGEDPILRDVRRLAEATDFQRRTVRRWLLGEGTVQASTARVLANRAGELGIRVEHLGLTGRVRSALGERREDDTEAQHAGHE
jgi:hypothetical protein